MSMTRKWFVWSVLPILVAGLSACQPKKPVTPVDTMDARTVDVAPPEEVKEPEAMPSRDPVETDPLDSEDFRKVNYEAARQGFNPDVHFEFDKSDLTTETRERLAGNAEWLRRNPQFAIKIEGHCDERGTNEYNLALGQKRATNTQDYLVSLGVAARRLSSISYGEERPACTQSDESCWWRNRRSHMVITGRLN